MENAEQGVDASGQQGQNPDVEAHAGGTGCIRQGVVTGKPGERLTVLVEGHPEEDDHGEHHDEGGDAVFGLFGGELHYRGAALGGLLGGNIGMFEPTPAGKINGDGNDEGNTGNCKAHVVRGGQVLDIVGAESGGIHSGYGSVRHLGLEL